jgi:1,2-diacylglycerol 3-beta-galactosyltransferase
MRDKARVLLLVADYGFGHRKAADAIAAALRGRHAGEVEVEIVNPLEDPRAPDFLRENQSDYDRLVREMPDLYRLGYRLTDATVPSRLIESAMTLLLLNTLRKLIQKRSPGVVVCTYPLYQAILALLFTVERRAIPLVTVVTDLASVHRMWFHPAADLCLVPTHKAFDLAVEAGLQPERVIVTGIPVDPRLAPPEVEMGACRASLGWNPDLFTVLAVGGKRVRSFHEVLRALDGSGLPLQLAVVAGGAEDLERELRGVDWRLQVHLYGLVEDMPPLMHAANCVLSKAGGLIVTEALACARPLLLVDIIPGQEEGNAEFVVEKGAGDLVQGGEEALKVLRGWLADEGELYGRRVAAARRAGRPRAAWEVAEWVWRAMRLGEGA